MRDDDIAKDPFAGRIIDCALSPSGSQVAILSNMGQIYLCDSRPERIGQPSRLKKATAKLLPTMFKPGAVRLSFGENDEINVFWIRDRRMMVRNIRFIGGNETILEYDMRSELDRLVSERTAPMAEPKQSYDYGAMKMSFVEMDGWSPISKGPSLPELPSS